MTYKNCIRTVLNGFTVLAILFGSFAFANDQQKMTNEVGDWLGVLSVPGQNLRLWLVVERDSQGALNASLESVDQAPGKKMIVENISIQDNEMRFEIPSISAKYRGKWNSNKQQWNGTFSQGQKLDLTLTRGKPQIKPAYNALNGKWKGDILGHPLIVRIMTSDLGTVAFLDSPDEGVTGLPISALLLKERSVSFEIVPASVKFTGELDEENGQISGKWIQQNQALRNITFVKQEEFSEQVNRPQHPSGSLPYVVKPVSFKNEEAVDVELAGTLTLPEGRGPFPAAILISGSGPQDRDETFMGHKPFAVIADFLTRNGIAVLRYDDRGVASSKGDYSAATSFDFASDANAAFNYLSSQQDINANAIGMIGHSEGGLIAPLAADTNKNLAFIILLAGPGVNTLDLMLAQQQAMNSLQNVPEEKTKKMMAISRKIMENVRNSTNEEAAIKSVTEILTPDNLAIIGASETTKSALIGSFTTPWYRYFMRYDPAQYFTDKALPILALSGELDVQVPAQQNLAGLKAILSEHFDATLTQLPGLNHMFQQAQTGSMNEYREIEQTFSPDALALISSWITERF